ncbi:Chitin bind 4 domain containing protein [Asbolus verrucosus]|uniref:Chitin bind 4 domain containing protein n=1 Tax=Asbolus verrucosus TaxID=1661398 RepID=A0A482VHC4_ASBVE|nr:Chitin bind 4 domain containing protein [Asbolus verrucosus]
MQILSVEGQYRYKGPDNIVYLVEYTADENGYQPEVSKLSDYDELPRLSGAAIASLTGGNLG